MAAEVESLPIFVVDAFTDYPFKGNPAAVCLVGAQDLGAEVYQNIAKEMNLSETAFISQKSQDQTYEKGSSFGLRWFTPTVEVPLCGHATLASAAVLFKVLGNPSEQITFSTLSGDLTAVKQSDAICLDLPLNSTEEIKQSDITGLSDILKEAVGDFPIASLHISRKTKKLLVELGNTVKRSDLEGLKPNITAMLSCHDGSEIRGVILTLCGNNDNQCCDDGGRQYDFISRYFAPWVGIPEDPVTGSAHTVLASYWSQKLGKSKLYARQCSDRGGDLSIQIQDNNRVDVAGKAAIVLQGQIKIK